MPGGFPCLSRASDLDCLFEREIFGDDVFGWPCCTLEVCVCAPGQPAYVPQNPQVLNASAPWQGSERGQDNAT